MKRNILVILFCIGFFTVKAQTVNLKIGQTFSKMKWYNSIASNTVFEKGYFGLITTIGIDYLRKKNFNLSSNIGYINNGGKGTILAVDPANPANGQIIGIMTTLHTLTVNTIANLKFMIGKNISPFIGLGPRLEYLVTYKEDVGLLVQFEEINELNKTLYGFIGVAGINYDLNKFQLGLEFQYNYTLNKMVYLKTRSNEVENEISIDYSTVALSIGYKLK